ncbi:cysteine peptidase family C39 domain-containing protein, partial [Candidatus Omnitrophota bacterium]
MDKPKEALTPPEGQSEFQPQVEEPRFKSGFKAWIRVVALVVLMIFIPEQVAQAVQYDFSMLWKGSQGPTGTFLPQYAKNPGQMDIPLAVKNILSNMAGKKINAIRLSPEFTLELQKPLNISKQRIDEIYAWLKGKPCGSKALYDFLAYKGVSVVEQDVAVLALTIDILNDVVKAEGEPEVIKNSLFALSRASEFFGHKLYPAKIDEGLSPQGTVPLTELTPFIAHLNGDHYVLVTRITEDKVYFLDQHKEEFLPVGKFLEGFSGYILTAQPDSSGLTAVADSEAKLILGAKSRKYEYPNLNMMFWQPDWKDSLINIGFNIGFGVVGGGNFASFAEGVFISNVSQLGTYLAVQAGASPQLAQFLGGVSTAALGGLQSLNKNPNQFLIKGAAGSVWNNNPAIRGLTMGALQGAIIGGVQYKAYAELKDTDYYKYNPEAADKTINLASNWLGCIGFSAVTAGMGMNRSWQGGEFVPQGKFGKDFLGGLGAAFKDSYFNRSSVTQGLGILIEYGQYASEFGMPWEKEKWMSVSAREREAWQNSNRFSQVFGDFTTDLLGGGLGELAGGGNFGKGFLSGLKTAFYRTLLDYTLTKWAGNYRKGGDGVYRNKWGLTRTQMSALAYGATASILPLLQEGDALLKHRGWDWGRIGRNYSDNFKELAANYLTFGGTAPAATGGAMGWSFVMYNAKLNELAGITNFAANADRMMRSLGYLSWKPGDPEYYNPLKGAGGKTSDETLERLKKYRGRGYLASWQGFVKDGHLGSLFPPQASALNEYLASTLYSTAANNLMRDFDALGGIAGSVGFASWMMIKNTLRRDVKGADFIGDITAVSNPDALAQLNGLKIKDWKYQDGQILAVMQDPNDGKLKEMSIGTYDAKESSDLLIKNVEFRIPVSPRDGKKRFVEIVPGDISVKPYSGQPMYPTAEGESLVSDIDNLAVRASFKNGQVDAVMVEPRWKSGFGNWVTRVAGAVLNFDTNSRLELRKVQKGIDLVMNDARGEHLRLALAGDQDQTIDRIIADIYARGAYDYTPGWQLYNAIKRGHKEVTIDLSKISYTELTPYLIASTLDRDQESLIYKEESRQRINVGEVAALPIIQSQRQGVFNLRPVYFRHEARGQFSGGKVGYPMEAQPAWSNYKFVDGTTGNNWGISGIVSALLGRDSAQLLIPQSAINARIEAQFAVNPIDNPAHFNPEQWASFDPKAPEATLKLDELIKQGYSLEKGNLVYSLGPFGNNLCYYQRDLSSSAGLAEQNEVASIGTISVFGFTVPRVSEWRTMQAWHGEGFGSSGSFTKGEVQKIVQWWNDQTVTTFSYRADSSGVSGNTVGTMFLSDTEFTLPLGVEAVGNLIGVKNYDNPLYKEMMREEAGTEGSFAPPVPTSISVLIPDGQGGMRQPLLYHVSAPGAGSIRSASIAYDHYDLNLTFNLDGSLKSMNAEVLEVINFQNEGKLNIVVSTIPAYYVLNNQKQAQGVVSGKEEINLNGNGWRAVYETKGNNRAVISAPFGKMGDSGIEGGMFISPDGQISINGRLVYADEGLISSYKDQGYAVNNRLLLPGSKPAAGAGASLLDLGDNAQFRLDKVSDVDRSLERGKWVNLVTLEKPGDYINAINNILTITAGTQPRVDTNGAFELLGGNYLRSKDGTSSFIYDKNGDIFPGSAIDIGKITEQSQPAQPSSALIDDRWQKKTIYDLKEQKLSRLSLNGVTLVVSYHLMGPLPGDMFIGLKEEGEKGPVGLYKLVYDNSLQDAGILSNGNVFKRTTNPSIFTSDGKEYVIVGADNPEGFALKPRSEIRQMQADLWESLKGDPGFTSLMKAKGYTSRGQFADGIPGLATEAAFKYSEKKFRDSRGQLWDQLAGRDHGFDNILAKYNVNNRNAFVGNNSQGLVNELNSYFQAQQQLARTDAAGVPGAAGMLLTTIVGTTAAEQKSTASHAAESGRQAALARIRDDLSVEKAILENMVPIPLEQQGPEGFIPVVMEGKTYLIPEERVKSGVNINRWGLRNAGAARAFAGWLHAETADGKSVWVNMRGLDLDKCGFQYAADVQAYIEKVKIRMEQDPDYVPLVPLDVLEGVATRLTQYIPVGDTGLFSRRVVDFGKDGDILKTVTIESFELVDPVNDPYKAVVERKINGSEILTTVKRGNKFLLSGELDYSAFRLIYSVANSGLTWNMNLLPKDLQAQYKDLLLNYKGGSIPEYIYEKAFNMVSPKVNHEVIQNINWLSPD